MTNNEDNLRAEFEEQYPTDDLNVTEKYLMKTSADFFIDKFRKHNATLVERIEELPEFNGMISKMDVVAIIKEE